MKREFNLATDTTLLPGTQLVGKIIKFDRPKVVTYLKVKSQSIKKNLISLYLGFKLIYLEIENMDFLRLT